VAAQYPDPADYCTAMLFNQASQRFKMEDLLEDVDGFNIALKLKNNPSLSIADALTQYYKPPDNHSGYQSRLRDFWNARFAAVDVANRAPGLVYGMLFGLGADGGLYEAAKLTFGAQRVLQSAYGLDKYDQVNIPYISPSVSARFCQRFLTVYKDLMNKEAATFS
jgi:hypothetical protein